MLCDSRRLLVCGQLWSKLNSPAHDAIWLDRDGGDAITRYLEVIPWVSLTNVGCERALELRISLAGKRKIVVSVKAISILDAFNFSVFLTS